MTNNDFFAPVDSVSVTDRQNAEQRLREAHRLGRIDNSEFDARMARVITAERLDELAAAVDGPLPQLSTSPYTSYTGYSEPSGAGQSYTGRSAPSSNGHPTFSGVVQSTGQSISERGTGMALLAHLSPFLTWLIGPAVIWAFSAKGSYTRSEAAKAFNWQLVAFIIGLLVSVIGWILPGEGNPIAGIWTAAWVIMTVIGAVMASRGADWKNPIRRLVPLELLNERGR
jgi:uncharacterized Tic20 family protein